MSIKTLKKRIAVGAVSALTAGVLSVASAPVANAAITATASIDRDSYDWSTAAGDRYGQCASPTDAAANADQTGEILVAGGTFALALDSTVADIQMDVVNDQISFVISGPARWDAYTADASAPATAAFVSDKNLTFTATNTTSADAAPLLVKGKITGAGSVQISVVVNDGGTATTIERYTLTASTVCATGTASVANSFVKVAEYGVDGSAIADNITSTEDKTGSAPVTNLASSADKISNGGTANIAVRIKDGTVAASDVTTQGVFSATATNGAVIGWDAAALALQASTATTSGPASGNPQIEALSVIQGTANEDKPLTTTVSIFFNGVLYGTRTISFTGAPTKISIVPALSSIGKTSTTNKYVLVYEITDAAGNKLTSGGAGSDGAAAFSTAGSENNPVLATSGSIVDPTQSVVTSISTINNEASGYFGTVDIGCGATSGTAKVTLKYTFSNLSSIVSDPYDFRCSGSAVNYKASLDKASYVPGDIATLTITATDSKGNPTWDLNSTPVGQDLGSSTYPVSILLPQMTAVTAATNVDEFSGGKKTYKFTVGTTEGTYSGVTDLPLYNSTTYAQVAQTLTYKIASGTATVSNADVLKSIVALIASINKQIQALQKLILKR